MKYLSHFLRFFIHFYQGITQSHFDSIMILSLIHCNIKTIVETFLTSLRISFALSKKHAKARNVAVPDRFRFRDAGCAVVSAAILSRRQLSADLLKIYLRWIKRADRRGSREQSRSARPNPRWTTVQRHTILLLKAPAPLKRESFIFEQAIIHYRERRERERESNRGHMQTTLSCLSRSPQWWV